MVLSMAQVSFKSTKVLMVLSMAQRFSTSIKQPLVLSMALDPPEEKAPSTLWCLHQAPYGA